MPVVPVVPVVSVVRSPFVGDNDTAPDQTPSTPSEQAPPATVPEERPLKAETIKKGRDHDGERRG